MNCFRFASSASALEDQWPCGKELCNFSSEAFVCVNFRSLASYWPRPWSDFGVPWGARQLPKGGPETSKRQPQTTQTVSLECLWGAFGAGPPEGGRGPQGDNLGDPKWASRCRGAQFFKKHTKTMSISLRRNVHAVEARSPYWSKEGAGRTRITT